jgi:hypothetical protein
MADEMKTVDIGTLLIDATPFAEFIVDLPPGARQGLRSEQAGYGDAVAEVVSNQAVWGDQAGITAGDFAELTLANERIAKIDALLPAARKMVEVLEETRALLDDRRQRQVSAIATAVEGRAKALRKPELLAKYEKTRAYRSAIAMKAARTRRRNAGERVETPAVAQPAANPG